MTSRFERRLARIEKRQRLALDPTPDPRGFVLATLVGFYHCDRREDQHPLQAYVEAARGVSGDADAAMQRLLEDFFASRGVSIDTEPTPDGVKAMQRLLDGVPEWWREADLAWWPSSATEMWAAPEHSRSSAEQEEGHGRAFNMAAAGLAEASGAAATMVLRRDCEKRLMAFARFCWPMIDPGTPMIEGYVVDAIADHLEQVAFGSIRRLLITVPPGTSKSSMTSVFFPCWSWGPLGQTHKRFISASYSEHLSVRDNNRCRRILENDEFQALWPHVRLVPPTTFRKFENTDAGWKLATSVGGVAIGERCDCWLIDDPNSAVGAESEKVRTSTNRWFREVVPTRLNDPKTGAIVLIQQRIHLQDVAGVALDQGDWVHLCLPMEYEPRSYVQAWTPDETIETRIDEDADATDEDDVFWRDWRTRDGELLWPERFPADVVEQLKRRMTPVAVAAMFQQRPVPRGGAIIRHEWWQPFKEAKFPPFDFILASLDTAYTEDRRNDPSGMTVWGLCKDIAGNPRVILLYAWQDYLMLHELVERVIHTCTRSPDFGGPAGAGRFPVDTLVIEGRASGLSVAQEIARLVGQSRLFAVDIVNPVDDKTARLHSIQHIFASGTIWAPDRAYADQVIDQVASFPYAAHDEFVDCSVMAIRWLRDRGFTPTREEELDRITAETAYLPKLQPLYPA